MGSLLSELLGRGVLSNFGDDDLTERVQRAAADHEDAICAALTTPQPSAPQAAQRVSAPGSFENAQAMVDFARRAEQQVSVAPAAKVLFRQDDDGLEPVMFYGPGSEPDPSTLKDRFVIRDVWLSPPATAQQVAEARATAWISASELEKLKAGHAAFVTPGGGDGDTPLYSA